MARPEGAAAGGIRKIHHLGIAVRSIDSTLGFYEGVLGLVCEHVEEVKSQHVRAAFLPAGEARIELIEPTSPASAVARFLDKRGEGIHHVAFEVESAARSLAQAESQGVRLVDKAPREGARGCLVGFLQPESCHGVLVEFVEERGAR